MPARSIALLAGLLAACACAAHGAVAPSARARGGVRVRMRRAPRAACRALAVVWEECDGCQVLRPSTAEPRAIVHFLGGVFASPSPQVLYRHMLQRLASKGYVIVANPYAVDFDYLATADSILERYEMALPEVQRRCGAELPQFAVGHSLGALMHTTIGSLFAESMPRYAGAALIAHNNKQLRDAVPGFEDIVVPTLAPYSEISRLPSYRAFIDSASALRKSSIALARDVVGTSPATAAYAAILDDVAEISSLVDQVPSLFEGIAAGQREFTPTPDELRRALRTSYALPRTLVASFSQDSIDESDALEACLQGKPGVERLRLGGTHLTPLAPDPTSLPASLLRQTLPASAQFDDLVSTVQASAMRDLDTLVDQIDEWARRVLRENAAAQR
ncbi:hypothetical protein KFE25_006750 [Diacronema lutheri]|uniref:AB hydrolase-1 domain-containing protein n=1 Tax=Diacronema lutheri TaxID=2081491 RepID=A0A8J5XMG6_DIALT|nr:hypothetical protein KFE25_006750 [Diacronema lutheri]